MSVIKNRFVAAGMSIIAIVALGCERAVAPVQQIGDLRFSVVSGEGQTGAAGEQLAQPLVVKVTKPNGSPQKGQIVNFRVVAGNGSVYGGASLTDDGGLAQELWTLGTRAGEPQRVEVRAVDPVTGQAQVFAVFNARSIAGAAANIAIVLGDNQTVYPTATAETSPTVRVTDRLGNPTSGVSVTFTPDWNGGTPTPATASTDARGRASVSWRVGFVTQQGAHLTAAVAGSSVAVTFEAFVYNCGCWSLNTNMPVATGDFGIVGAAGKLYVIGGAKDNFALAAMQVYDPLTETWNSKVLPTARRAEGAAQIDGIVYAVGGYNEQGMVADLDAYDPQTDTWTSKAPIPTPRHSLGAVAIGGILYAVGGVTFEGFSTALEAYDPATNTWTRKADMPIIRRDGAVVAAGGIIYVIGGLDENYQITNTVLAYDPTTNSWSIKASMPTRRYFLAAAEGYGLVYAMGGLNQNYSIESAVEVYDPATDTWQSRGTMINARWQFRAAMLDGYIYVPGGVGSNYTFISKMESFLP